MRQGYVALLMALGPAPALAQPLMTRLDAVSGIPKLDETTQTEEVRFKTGADDRMTVPVRLSGVGPFRFLVDTGADRTAISRQIAGRLGLVRGETAALHTVTGVSSVSTANVPALEMTRKPVKIRDAPLLDSAAMGADGIIGVDSLKSKRVEFNFETDTLSIVPSAVTEPRDACANAIANSAPRRDVAVPVTGTNIFKRAAARSNRLAPRAIVIAKGPANATALAPICS